MKPEIHKDNLNKNSRWLTRRYEILIDKKVTPEQIWEYAYNPKTWTQSNPDEHLGLVFYNNQNRPETGVAFYQKETVSGVYADLRGHILYAEKPNVCVFGQVWRSIDFLESYLCPFQKMELLGSKRSVMARYFLTPFISGCQKQ